MAYLLTKVSHCNGKIKCPFTTIWNKLDFNLELSHLIATVTAHVSLVHYNASGFSCIFTQWLFSQMPLGFLSVKYTVRPQWHFQNINFQGKSYTYKYFLIIHFLYLIVHAQ